MAYSSQKQQGVLGSSLHKEQGGLGPSLQKQQGALEGSLRTRVAEGIVSTKSKGVLGPIKSLKTAWGAWCPGVVSNSIVSDPHPYCTLNIYRSRSGDRPSDPATW